MKRRVLVGIAIALVAVVSAVWVVSRDDGSGDGSGDGSDGAVTAAATSGSTTTVVINPNEPVTPPATASADAPSVDVTTLAPVAVNEPGAFGDGLVATVVEAEQVNVAAQGPGDTAGPAVAIHLELRNDGATAVDLGGLAVNASDSDGNPAAPNFAPPTVELSGSLAPGEARTGVYVFRVDDRATALSVDVHHNTSSKIVIINT